MKLTTTFNLLREHNACNSGYRKLAKHLGGVRTYGVDTEINLLTILESNGFDDAVWCLRATKQDAEDTKRLIAADFAESVLHIYEAKYPDDQRPRMAVNAARSFAAGGISQEHVADIAEAAVDAAKAVYNTAGYTDSAYTVAYAAYAAYAAVDTTYAAAYAAYDAAYEGTSLKEHKDKLIKILIQHLSE